MKVEQFHLMTPIVEEETGIPTKWVKKQVLSKTRLWRDVDLLDFNFVFFYKPI